MSKYNYVYRSVLERLMTHTHTHTHTHTRIGTLNVGFSVTRLLHVGYLQLHT
jgi:hypothetical protein